MKKLGFKFVGMALSLVLMNAVLAAEPTMENVTAPSNEDVLTPGAKVIAGLPGKNDIYILGQNEKMPTELTDKAKADAAAKKAIIVQQKSKAKPTDNTPAIAGAATDNIINAPVTNPTLNIVPASDTNLAAPTQMQMDKSVSSMKKTTHRNLSLNKHHSKPAYLNKVAQSKQIPKYLQKVAQNKSHHTTKHTVALKTNAHSKIKVASKTHHKTPQSKSIATA